MLEIYEQLKEEVYWADAENGPMPGDWFPTFKQLWKTASSMFRYERRCNLQLADDGPYGRII